MIEDPTKSANIESESEKERVLIAVRVALEKEGSVEFGGGYNAGSRHIRLLETGKYQEDEETYDMDHYYHEYDTLEELVDKNISDLTYWYHKQKESRERMSMIKDKSGD